MNIITAAESRSMPGSFTVIASGPEIKRNWTSDCRGADEAAAKAVQYAQSAGSPYCIVAGKKVLAYIPEEVRRG